MSGRNDFLKIYFAAAVAICLSCTLIISYNCSCPEDLPCPFPQLHERKPDVKEETYLLVTIMTAPNETATRAVIRDTWIKFSTKSHDVARHKFIIGTKNLGETERLHLEEEQSLHGDLALLTDLEENYANLARKTLMTMEYAYQKFDANFILKVDSDSFVRLNALIKVLKDNQHPRLYWGFLDGRAKPIRKGKWKESTWILCDRYLPYHLGGGYVLSFELVRFLAVNSKLFKMYKNEDVSVGAWLAGLDVKYVHDPRFDTEWVSRGCHNEYLITHKKNVTQMEALATSLSTTGMLCEREYRTRYSYVYDWSVPPSECCARRNNSRIP